MVDQPLNLEDKLILNRKEISGMFYFDMFSHRLINPQKNYAEIPRIPICDLEFPDD